MKLPSKKNRKVRGTSVSPPRSKPFPPKSVRGRQAHSRSARPFVAATFAMTVDGKITTKNFTPVDFTWMLEQLHSEYQIRSVACEGGATLFRALLEEDLVDQLNLTIAPYLFGGAHAPTLTGLSKDFLPRSVQCSLTEMRTVGEECF